MMTIRLTVNGEGCSAGVSERTQLAELLRDHLHLTGTHLGCEHGVCGACTVLVDGRPIRSCITYALACEGANVVTVEGLGDDPTGPRAARGIHPAPRRAMRILHAGHADHGVGRRHPRLEPTDEAAIRHELSGNLCRCTGYMGIVAAVQDVARQRRAEAPTGVAAAGAAAVIPPRESDASADAGLAFEPFDVDPVHLGVTDTTETGPAGVGTARSMTQDDGWTLIEREFVMEHPVDVLWALFEDLPRVAACLPGVHIDSADAHRFTGRAEIRFGPVGAAFHGEGTRETDGERRAGVISGRGSDPRGHATLEAELRYAMSGDEPPGAPRRTRIGLAIRFRIQGALAQFNRGDLVEGFADVMLSDFVRNCERQLAGETIPPSAGAGGFALLWRMLKARLGLGNDRPT